MDDWTSHCRSSAFLTNPVIHLQTDPLGMYLNYMFLTIINIKSQLVTIRERRTKKMFVRENSKCIFPTSRYLALTYLELAPAVLSGKICPEWGHPYYLPGTCTRQCRHSWSCVSSTQSHYLSDRTCQPPTWASRRSWATPPEIVWAPRIYVTMQCVSDKLNATLDASY